MCAWNINNRLEVFQDISFSQKNIARFLFALATKKIISFVPPSEIVFDSPLFECLGEAPGIIFQSSGSTGEPKQILHNANRLLTKFKRPGKPFKTIAFLKFNHIGGINTLLYTLAAGGELITPESLTVQHVCEAIEKHKAELLPTTPSFLNFLLLSDVYKNYDMSSLRIVSYGTEPMPEITLDRLYKIFPAVRLKQTYGLAETGIIPTRSREGLWMELGDNVRVMDGVLEIKNESSMLGYLNAYSPFTKDGYFITGDKVEVAYQDNKPIYKILGRDSNIINVGGEKVYPAEIENVILQAPGVVDCVVFGEKNSIIGEIVCCKVVGEIDSVKWFCEERLEKYAVPVKIYKVDEIKRTESGKKVRA